MTTSLAAAVHLSAWVLGQLAPWDARGPMAPAADHVRVAAAPAAEPDAAASDAGPSAVAAPRPGQVQVAHVTLRSSLERALATADPVQGRALAAQVARLLRWRGDVARKVRPGDTLAVAYVRAEVAPNEPELLALHYAGELLNLEGYRFAAHGDGIDRFYDADAWRIEPTMRNPPVPRYWQITETVQRGRGKRRHKGDDFRAPEGSVVVLPFAGHVTRTNWSRRRNGRCIEVLLDAGYVAHFLHLQKLADDVRPGRRLAAGAVLGTVGNTGRSTGAHLHYELLRQHQPVEPLKVHGQRRDQLSGTDLPAFVALRESLREQLRGDGVTARTAAR